MWYTAPETCHSMPGQYSPKVDIWSTGCVVLEMLSGQRPWAGTDFMVAMLNVSTRSTIGAR